MENISYFLFVYVISSMIVPAPGTQGLGLFDPFMDNHPFSISWGGPLEFNKEEIELLGDRHVLVTTDKQERYQCILPKSTNDNKDGIKQYAGPTATQLLQPLFGQKECSYRIESYWTYELCHGKYLKQYHETRDPAAPKVQEYILGYGNHRDLEKGKEPEGERNTLLPVKELDGEELPYYEVIMTDGTKCDLTNQPRKTHVLYVCYKGGRGEVYEFKEISTCEYEVVVLTALLCNHPEFKPRTKAVTEIRCHSFFGSPVKPSQLVTNEHEARFFQAVGQDFVVPEYEPEPTVPSPKEVPPPEKPVMIHRKDTKSPQDSATTTPSPSKLGAITDKQTLREFFSGDKCLRGGHGWWKHEICYGKYAKQFHVEKGKEVSVYLGLWDMHKHLEWLKENPLKRPKELAFRRSVSQHYTNGDLCDLSGKPRTCEVRLKCIENTKNPHAVMLSLAEPAPCKYVLTVDSALFCPIMKNANKDGLFENLDLR